MKKLIFFALIFIQWGLFAQIEQYHPEVLFSEGDIKIELHRLLNGKDHYQKIILYEADHSEEIITIGIDTSAFKDINYKGNDFSDGVPLSAKFDPKKTKKRGNIFYKDSIFCFTATKLDMRDLTPLLIQCKKENGLWRVSKMLGWPTILTFMVRCNAFFVSEDIVYLDVRSTAGVKEGSKEAYTVHYPYMVILGENGTYTKFLQEGKEYPPQQPLYLPSTKH